MADILVTYFSRSGSIEKVARELAERLGADIDPIIPKMSYAGAAGYLRGLWQALLRRTPEVATVKDPARYALVLVGSPVWAGRLSAPVRSYLQRHGEAIKDVAVFCVSGSGAAYAGLFGEIERTIRRAPRSTLSLAQRDVLSGAYGPRLLQFVEKLRRTVPEAA